MSRSLRKKNNQSPNDAVGPGCGCRCSVQKIPFGFMELQEVQELTSFFERRVSAYQLAVKGEVAFNDDF